MLGLWDLWLGILKLFLIMVALRGLGLLLLVQGLWRIMVGLWGIFLGLLRLKLGLIYLALLNWLGLTEEVFLLGSVDHLLVLVGLGVDLFLLRSNARVLDHHDFW